MLIYYWKQKDIYTDISRAKAWIQSFSDFILKAMIWGQGKKGGRLRRLLCYMFSIGKENSPLYWLHEWLLSSAHVWNQVRCDSFSKYLLLSEKMQWKADLCVLTSPREPSLCPTHCDPLTGGENGGHKEKNVSPNCQRQMMELLQ